MNENQTTYPTGAQDEEEIDLVALMVTLLHKLKPILLTAVVCAVIAGGLAGVKILRGGAVSAEDQVAYEEALAEYQQKEKDYEFAVQQYELTAKSNEDAQSSVQEALKQAQDYAEKSLLKNLDVYNVWTAQADLYIDSGYKIQPGSAYQNVDPTGALLAAYQKQLVSGDSMNAAADAVGVDVRYLKGVVTVELSQNDSGEYNGVMTLQAYAADQQTAEKILNALLGRLDLIHDKAAAAVCSHSVRVIDQSVTQGVSTELRALQQTSSEDVQNLQSQLVELQSARQALDDNLASAKSTWESAEEPGTGRRRCLLGGKVPACWLPAGRCACLRRGRGQVPAGRHGLLGQRAEPLHRPARAGRAGQRPHQEGREAGCKALSDGGPPRWQRGR